MNYRDKLWLVEDFTFGVLSALFSLYHIQFFLVILYKILSNLISSVPASQTNIFMIIYILINAAFYFVAAKFLKRSSTKSGTTTNFLHILLIIFVIYYIIIDLPLELMGFKPSVNFLIWLSIFLLLGNIILLIVSIKLMMNIKGHNLFKLISEVRTR